MDVRYSKEILKLARKAAVQQEVPIGAIVVDRDGRIVGRGYNQTHKTRDVFGHAEIQAIRQAQKKLGDWRLERTTIYVTLEPCLMCLGAMMLGRVQAVHYVVADPTFGSLKTVLQKNTTKGVYKNLKFFHDSELELEVKQMMKIFFVGLRKKK